VLNELNDTSDVTIGGIFVSEPKPSQKIAGEKAAR